MTCYSITTGSQQYPSSRARYSAVGQMEGIHVGAAPARGSPHRYPSPQQHGLPFYQPVQPAQRQPLQLSDEQQQRDGASEGEELEAGAQQPTVPDDPQLRANLANMMGSFGGFGALQQHVQGHSTGIAGLPPGSVAFAQANNLSLIHI